MSGMNKIKFLSDLITSKIDTDTLTVSGDLTVKGTTYTEHAADTIVKGAITVHNLDGDSAKVSLMGQVILTGNYYLSSSYCAFNDVIKSVPATATELGISNFNLETALFWNFWPTYVGLRYEDENPADLTSVKKLWTKQEGSDTEVLAYDSSQGGWLILDGSQSLQSGDMSITIPSELIRWFELNVNEEATAIDIVKAAEAYAIVYDPQSDAVRLGTGIYDVDTNGFTFNEGEGAPIAVRKLTSEDDGSFIMWDADTYSLVKAPLKAGTGVNSIIQGAGKSATGNNSYAGGIGTVASGEGQTAIGVYNEESAGALFIVGNGKNNIPSNIFEVHPDRVIIDNVELDAKKLDELETEAKTKITYKITKSGDEIILTGSDGSRSSVVDTKNASMTVGSSPSLSSLGVSGVITAGMLNTGSGNILPTELNSIFTGAQNTATTTTVTGLVVGGYKNNVAANNCIISGFQNTIHLNGHHSIVVGNSLSNAGSQSAVFGYQNTNEGAQSVIGGYLNTNNGATNLMSGKNNIIYASETPDSAGSKWCCDHAVFGSSNIVNENRINMAGSLVFGDQNKCNKQNTMVGGSTCTTEGPHSIVVGNECTNSATGTQCAIFGYKNMNEGQRSFMMGTNNKIYYSTVETSPWSNSHAAFGANNIINANKINMAGGFVCGESNQCNRGNAMVGGVKCINNGGDSFVYGYNLVNNATRSIVGGVNNTVEGGGYHAIFGDNNIIATDTWSDIVGGNNNTIETASNNLICAGYYNNIKTKSSQSILVGGECTLNGERSAVFGGEQNITSSYGLISGRYHVTNHSGVFVTGVNNVSSRAAQSVLGYGAKKDSEALFIVGNGTGMDDLSSDYSSEPDRESRNNAFVVKETGDVVSAGKMTVGKAPENELDVATKKYVDDAIAQLMALINA